jgi:hypothetical protein
MLDALLQHLLEKPDQYLDEMEVFLWDEFEVRIPKPTISRTLRSAGWSKKTARRVAKEQNADLRDFCIIYPHFVLTTSYMLTIWLR